MAFTARISGTGVTDPYLSLEFGGSKGRYTVDWDDGTVETHKLAKDEQGFSFHLFDDGAFDVAVSRRPEAMSVTFHAEVRATAASSVVLDGTDGSDFLFAGQHDDQLRGGGGDDALVGNGGADVIDGAAGSDMALGGRGNDLVTGGDGNDTLTGGAGRDVIEGGDGDDTLIGESGKDILTGGAGHDRFIIMPQFGPTYSLAAGHDVITDFQSGVDKIAVINWPNIGDHLTFIGSVPFSAAAPELRVIAHEGFATVEGDYDGDGARDFWFRVEGEAMPTQGDFQL